MRGRRVAVGVGIVACALIALGAQSAGAVTGTTAFTCKKKAVEGGAGFADAHCREEVGSAAKYEHVAIPANTTTDLVVTNANTASETTAAQPVVLKTTLAGVVVELTASKVENVGEFENEIAGNGEHFVHGTGTTVYTGVVVHKPANKGCKVKGGTLTTLTLTGTSAGQGMAGELSPTNEEKRFLELTIEGCSIEVLNQTLPINGSVTCPISGSTAVCAHAEVTAASTLRYGGQKAGVEVSTTYTARGPGESTFTPLGFTTVTT